MGDVKTKFSNRGEEDTMITESYGRFANFTDEPQIYRQGGIIHIVRTHERVGGSSKYVRLRTRGRGLTDRSMYAK